LAVRRRHAPTRPANATAIELRGIRQSLNDPIPPHFTLRDGRQAPPVYIDLAAIESSDDARTAAREYATATLGNRTQRNGFTALETVAHRAICRAAGLDPHADLRARLTAASAPDEKAF
jgi:hypothetical protein